MKRNYFIFLLLITILLIGCSNEPVSDDDNSAVSINLYFSDEAAQYLVPEERIISEPTIAKAFEHLVLGPKNKDLYSTLPPKVKLLDAHVENNIAILNLNNEFDIAINGNYGTSTASILLLNSIAGTLVYNEIFDVKGIKILVEGSSDFNLGPYGDLDVFYPDEDAFK